MNIPLVFNLKNHLKTNSKPRAKTDYPPLNSSFCAADLTRVEVEEDDVAAGCGQTRRLQLGQVLQPDHQAAAVLREEPVRRQ